MILASFLIVLGAFFFRRFNPAVMQWVMLAGIVLFVSSFAILVFTRGRSASGGYWRGREIGGRSASLAERLRRWFASRRGDRR